MNRVRLVGVLAVSMTLAGLAHAQQPNADLLIIQFSGFDVGVLEPPGWHGAVDGAIVAFLRPTDPADQASPLIRVQVEKKVDKNAVENLSSHRPAPSKA